jgi:hypothetical protein
MICKASSLFGTSNGLEPSSIIEPTNVPLFCKAPV